MFVFYLWWVLVHYLDKFVTMFTTAQVSTNQIKQACIAYNWVTNLLGIPRNDLKDAKDTLVIVFGIKIDIKSFKTRLFDDKLRKAVKATNKVLAE